MLDFTRGDGGPAGHNAQRPAPSTGELIERLFPGSCGEAEPVSARRGSICADGIISLGGPSVRRDDLLDLVSQLERLCRQLHGSVESKAIIPALKRAQEHSILSRGVDPDYRISSAPRLAERAAWCRARLKETWRPVLKEHELSELRRVLIDGHHTVSLCATLREALDSDVRPRRARERLVSVLTRLAGRSESSPACATGCEWLIDQPALSVFSADLDRSAQRIKLGIDGGDGVRRQVAEEFRAARLLARFRYEVTVVPNQGALSAVVELIPRGGSYEPIVLEQDVDQVVGALVLTNKARSNLKCIADFKANPVVLCGLVDRSEAGLMRYSLAQLSTRHRHGADELTPWLGRLREDRYRPLDREERHSLGILMLEAQCLLSANIALDAVLGSKALQSHWRSLWMKASNDMNVRAALALLPSFSAPEAWGDACRIAGAVARLVGIHPEDIKFSGWSTRENPLLSLAWLLQREADGEPKVEP